MTRDRVAQVIVREIKVRGYRAERAQNHMPDSTSIYIKVSKKKRMKPYKIIRISDHPQPMHPEWYSVILQDGEKFEYTEHLVPLMAYIWDNVK